MVKLVMLAVYRQNGADALPFKLAETLNMEAFSFWTRSTIKDHLVFGARTVVQRTSLGCRQTVGLKDVPFLIHVYVRADGLSGVCVSDEDYPQRVAFALIHKTLDAFAEKVGNKWAKVTQDQDIEPPFMKEDLEKFQDPKNDKIAKIQADLDDVKEVMRNNIDEVLKRGETLDSLMDKSQDLSSSSKHFYKKAKSANSCCRSW